MGIVLIIAQNLLDVDDLGAGVPCDAATHQIPVVALLDRDFLQRRKRRDRHHHRTAVLQVHLKLPTLRKRQALYLWGHIPISFFLIHKLFRFLYSYYSDSFALLEQLPLMEKLLAILLGDFQHLFCLSIRQVTLLV